MAAPAFELTSRALQVSPRRHRAIIESVDRVRDPHKDSKTGRFYGLIAPFVVCG